MGRQCCIIKHCIDSIRIFNRLRAGNENVKVSDSSGGNVNSVILRSGGTLTGCEHTFITLVYQGPVAR